MAKIDSYTNDSVMNDADTLIGTDGAVGVDFGKTKEFRLGSIKTYCRSYAVWFVKTILEDGVVADIANAYENTIGNIVYSAGPSGTTKLTLAGAFPNIEKVVVFSNGVAGSPVFTHTTDFINVPTSNFIEVRVYY